MLKKTLIILLIMIVAACEMQPLKPVTEGEHMIVHYSSDGCFHHWSYVLDFHENDVKIYRTVNRWYNRKPQETELGTIKLTHRDQEKLEKLFAYYDGKLPQDCTTVDKIVIERYSEGTLLSSKEIKDTSCGLYEGEEILSFTEIISRTKKS